MGPRLCGPLKANPARRTTGTASVASLGASRTRWRLGCGEGPVPEAQDAAASPEAYPAARHKSFRPAFNPAGTVTSPRRRRCRCVGDRSRDQRLDIAQMRPVHRAEVVLALLV